jgi:hypothetical protein
VATGRRHHLTEKTFKPIAMGMPFVIVGTQGSLRYLRSYGFKTFGDLWDESYDDKSDYTTRIDKLVDIIQHFDRRSWDQRQVKEKLEYNRARFFDNTLTKKFCWETIVEPVLRFAE